MSTILAALTGCRLDPVAVSLKTMRLPGWSGVKPIFPRAIECNRRYSHCFFVATHITLVALNFRCQKFQCSVGSHYVAETAPSSSPIDASRSPIFQATRYCMHHVFAYCGIASWDPVRIGKSLRVSGMVLFCRSGDAFSSCSTFLAQLQFKCTSYRGQAGPEVPWSFRTW